MEKTPRLGKSSQVKTDDGVRVRKIRPKKNSLALDRIQEKKSLDEYYQDDYRERHGMNSTVVEVIFTEIEEGTSGHMNKRKNKTLRIEIPGEKLITLIGILSGAYYWLG